MGFLEDVSKQGSSVIRTTLSDDTSIHVLNRKFCVVSLIILALLVCAKQYVGEPIQCWCPAEFAKFHVSYANSYCWIKNTYSVPFDEILPVEDVEREDTEIEYYQWVPLIFVFMAFLFYLPKIFWKGFYPKSGINIKKTLNLASDATYLGPVKRAERMVDIASYIDKWIEIRDGRTSAYQRMQAFKETLGHRGCHYGNYLTMIYMVTCALYTVNTIGQLFLVDSLLGNDFLSLGPDFVKGVSTNQKWEDLKRFPRVTFCDFNIRQLQNIQRWTVQCSLPINLFNEKMFIILWFLLVIMSFVNAVNFIYNFAMLFFPRRKNEYIKRFIDEDVLSPELRNSSRLSDVQVKFVDKYLRQDGVFLIWLINHNTSPVVASEIVAKLWKDYCDKPHVRTFLSLSSDA
ncbi:innexin unc-7-like [Mizuhopecten yessoensis]|uniref:Innexin n=1 Tax=Mizuhopecten yessoensis TaxID=6573 RepID=A0A210Q0Y0_MIZYE|nr:innexin unc-7-like [Mizuhopecten yessoensis]OWF42365.1 Innexin unc-7 [Mizuhopecten yessoensis]